MPSNLPADCATYDNGGGVRLRKAFVVYTTNPYHAHLQAIAPQLRSTLAILASTVSRHIDIHYTLPPGNLLCSLPHGPPTQPSRLAQAYLETRDRPQIPSFFVNTSSSRELCIAGIQDAVTTLLSVLRRPWCVLELCGSGLEAVEALLAFAEAAEGFSEKEYGGAVALLRHQRWYQVVEEQRSVALDGFCVSGRLRGRKGREEKPDLRDIWSALFREALNPSAASICGRLSYVLSSSVSMCRRKHSALCIKVVVIEDAISFNCLALQPWATTGGSVSIPFL